MNDINWQAYRSSIQTDLQWKKRAKAALVAFTKRESNQKEIVYSGAAMHRTKYATALLFLLVLILVPRTFAAANQSRPGQFLYPFKLLGEKVRFAVASDEMKPQVKVTVTVERTRELESSVIHDPEIVQMEAAAHVEKARDDIESLREDIRYDTYRRVKEHLTKIKESAKNERGKKRLDEKIAPLDERLKIQIETTPTPTPGNSPMSFSPSPTRTQSSPGNSSSDVRVETNDGYTQVTINGTVVVSLAPTRDDTEIEVNVHGNSVKVKTKSENKNESSIHIKTED